MAERTKAIPANKRVEIVSTKTVERRFRFKSSYVIRADVQ